MLSWPTVQVALTGRMLRRLWLATWCCSPRLRPRRQGRGPAAGRWDSGVHSAPFRPTPPRGALKSDRPTPPPLAPRPAPRVPRSPRAERRYGWQRPGEVEPIRLGQHPQDRSSRDRTRTSPQLASLACDRPSAVGGWNGRRSSDAIAEPSSWSWRSLRSASESPRRVAASTSGRIQTAKSRS